MKLHVPLAGMESASRSYGMALTAMHASLADADFVSRRAATSQALNALVIEIARTDIPALLVGEGGTGKEVYARLLHRLSDPGEAPFKKMNCAALDTRRLIAEIQENFRPFSGGEEAQAGTVFLDCVHELDATCQRVLLAALRDVELRGPAGKVPRIISSTSRNLEEEIAAGRFLRELYFRINGAILRLPPLRERREDIPSLMEHFLRKHANELKKSAPEIGPEAQVLFDSYDWPGNIRELGNVAKKIVALGNFRLAIADLRESRLSVQKPDEDLRASSLKVASRAASRQAERELIQKALDQTHWNRKQAAQILQISYKSLLYKIKQTGLEGPKTGGE